MLFDYLLSQAAYAHFYIVFLFLLAGFCLPISEDILIITAAIISVKYAPNNREILFLSCYLGAYSSDIICYSLGRKFGHNLLTKKPFSKFISKKHLSRVERFYANHSILTLFFGRFIPFGIRNVIFLTAGMSKMHPVKFLSVDALSCLASSALLFYLGRRFADNSEYLFDVLQPRLNAILSIIALAIVAICYGVYSHRRRRKQHPSSN
ncbi:MAG: DedA family protein [Proteobacteria bacterium]|nr:DedA family protein [Pseudomonadota bacterium]